MKNNYNKMDGKKRRPSCKATMETSTPEVLVHASWPEGLKQNIRVRAHAVNEKGFRIPGIAEVTKTARSQEEIPLVLDELREIVIERMKPARKKTQKSKLEKGMLDEDTRAVKALRKLENSAIKIGRWGEVTQKKALQNFRRNVLAEIQYCESDEDFGPEQKANLYEKLRCAALTHGNSRGSIADAEDDANRHMIDAGIIYSAMVSIDETLPELTLLTGERTRRVQQEMVKMIPIGIHAKFRELVEASIATDPLYVRSAALMDAGLRSAEAAGMLSDEMKDNGNYIVVYVQFQERNGNRDIILKSDAAYRPVVIDYWGTEIIRRCNGVIKQKGIAEDPKKAPVDSKKLSKWVKEKLQAAGCDDEFMQKANMDMLMHPDRDTDGNEIDDISAHVLRRHRVTIQTVIMGYDRVETDITIGHEVTVTEAVKESFKTREVQDELAIKNSRYDIIPALSNSPRFLPIQIKHGEDIEIRAFPEVNIMNSRDEKIRVTLDIDASVMGETIEISTDGEIIEMERSSSYNVKDRAFVNNEIIGDPWMYMDYEDVIGGGEDDEE